MARLVLEDVGKVYPNGLEAVRGLQLDIADGELLVLVGPSGCGKSTTLRMIAGLESTSRGRIIIGQRVVNHLLPKDRNVAMVFQNHVLYPQMTAYQNMAFPLKLRGHRRAEIDRKVRQAAAMLGIEHLLHRKPHQLSGGQRQRVALGRAVVRQPACFLLDEPLCNLDAPLRGKLQGELKRLHRKLAITTVHVTHDQQEALALGQRIAVMHQGRIQQTGSPEQVYRHPANRFVAGFIGASRMNFLQGRIIEHDGRLWFDEGTQRVAVPDWAAGPLGARVGDDVVLGIRPEVISLAPLPGQTGNALEARIDAAYRLGEKLEVHFSTGRDLHLVACLDGRLWLDPGAIARMYVDLDRVHFFQPDDRAAGRWGANCCLEAEIRHSRQAH